MIKLLMVDDDTLYTTKLSTLGAMDVIIVQDNESFWYHKDKVRNFKSNVVFPKSCLAAHIDRLLIKG